MCTYAQFTYYEGKALQIVKEEHLAKTCSNIVDHTFVFTSPKIFFNKGLRGET